MKKRAFYDTYDYRGFWANRGYEDEADRLALNGLIGQVSTERCRLLDAGCGFGRNAPSYAPFWDEVVLLDPSQKTLNQAKKSLEDYHNLQFILGQAESLPFPRESFDAVVCVRVFHHLPDPGPAIGEFGRVLKPNGFLILEFANKLHVKAVISSLLKGKWGPLWSPEPLDRRSEKSVREGTIPFVNHHPERIVASLRKGGFEILDTLSVSNFRSSFMARVLPFRFLIWLEKVLQRPLGKFWFGPSLYILARKA